MVVVLWVTNDTIGRFGAGNGNDVDTCTLDQGASTVPTNDDSYATNNSEWLIERPVEGPYSQEFNQSWNQQLHQQSGQQFSQQPGLPTDNGANDEVIENLRVP